MRRNKTKKIIVLLLMGIILLSACSADEPGAELPPNDEVVAETTEPKSEEELEIPENPASDFEWEMLHGFPEIIINRYIGTSAKVRIPAFIDGMPVELIGEGAFRDTAITHVQLPESVNWISGYAFFNCPELAEINIPSVVTRIGDSAFSETGLTSITLPERLNSLGMYVFNGSSSLKNIFISENNGSFRTVDGVLFKKDMTRLIKYPESRTNVSYTVPDGVTHIGQHSFNRTGIINVTLPDSITSIEWGAFGARFGEGKLTEINIPDSVFRIGDMAFYDSGLTSVTYRGVVYGLNEDGRDLSQEFYDAVNHSRFVGRDDLLPLELLGYAIHEGEMLILQDNWTDTLAADDFRRYFFGTWEVVNGEEGRITFTLDDTIDTKLNINFFDGGFFDTGHNAIVRWHGNNVNENAIYWIDYENPDIMYLTVGYHNSNFNEQHGNVFRNFGFADGEFIITIYRRTDAPIAEPTDGYLSNLRLWEISVDYGISWNMLTQMHLTDIEGRDFFHNDHLWFYPIYMVSEEPDKFIFNTSVGTSFLEETADVTYTIERINGEWVRTIESDRELREP
jgi:hypothetical protein